MSYGVQLECAMRKMKNGAVQGDPAEGETYVLMRTEVAGHRLPYVVRRAGGDCIPPREPAQTDASGWLDISPSDVV